MGSVSLSHSVDRDVGIASLRSIACVEQPNCLYFLFV